MVQLSSCRCLPPISVRPMAQARELYKLPHFAYRWRFAPGGAELSEHQGRLTLMGSPRGTEPTHSGLSYRYSSAPVPYAMTYDKGRRSRRDGGWSGSVEMPFLPLQALGPSRSGPR
jgi:hypothetical protein